MFNKRQKPGLNASNTNEEILAQEKAFFQHLQQTQQSGLSFEPAAKVFKKSQMSAQLPEEGLPEKIDKKAEEVDLEGDQKLDCPQDHKIAMQLEHPKEPVVSDSVIERVFDVTKLLPFTGQRSIPITKQIEIEKSGNRSNNNCTKPLQGKSLFARTFDTSFISGGLIKPSISNKDGPDGDGTAKLNPNPTVCDQIIHPSLAGMTEEEILAEQKKIIEKLDPKLLEFIRSRKNKQPYVEVENQKNEVEKMDVDISKEVAPEILNVVAEADLPINPNSVKCFVGMDKLETDKLAWTGLLNNERSVINKSEVGANARFDFHGVLVLSKAMNDPSTFDKGLHNHGEEMERPGYALEELLTLSRSSNFQQRVAAFQIIGNIYAHAHTGMYDEVFDKSLFELVNNMDFVYAIRKGLDEEDITLINMAIQCLAKIIYPWEEEVCLDIVYLWDDSKPHPLVSTKSDNFSSAMDSSITENDMKDSEILQVDLLEFFIHRSSLLERITYLMEKGDHLLTQSGVQGILKILIRVARHSPDVLLKQKLLIRIIIEKYISANWTKADINSPDLNGVPLPMALKLVRLLIDSSQSNAAKIYNEFNLFPVLMSFLTYDDWKSQSHLQMTELLTLESFRIWIAFITQGFAIEEYLTFFPVLMKFMMFYQNSDRLPPFDLVHSGHVISLLQSLLRMKDDSKGILDKDKHSHWDLVKDTVSFVEQYIFKLLCILSSPHLQGNIDENSAYFAVSKGLRFLIEAHQYGNDELSKNIISGIRSFLSSACYAKITLVLRAQSVILMEPAINERYPANFASIKAVRFGGKLNPTIEHGFSLPLIAAICAVVKVTDSIPKENILNSNMKAYVSDIIQFSGNQSHKADFFVRFELSCIFELAELYPASAPEKFSLLYKVISEVPKCCSTLFNRLFKLTLASSCSDSDKDSCFQIYGGYLLQEEKIEQNNIENNTDSPKKKVRFEDGTKFSSTIIELGSWTEMYIGSHWILEPIEKIYTIVTSTPNYVTKNLQAIEKQCSICFKLIEKCLESYVDFIIQSPKDFVTIYCGICQIFLLGDPRIYIDEVMSPILANILRILTRCNIARVYCEKPIFSKQRRAEGLPNMFFDFYPDLLKEYLCNSYFNETFASYLMVPIRTPEDSQIKSNFWMLECLNSIKISVQKSIIPIDFLIPIVEKDTKMLEIFLMRIKTKKITKENNEFLFEIIRLNLQNAVEKMDSTDLLREEFMKLNI